MMMIMSDMATTICMIFRPAKKISYQSKLFTENYWFWTFFFTCLVTVFIFATILYFNGTELFSFFLWPKKSPLTSKKYLLTGKYGESIIIYIVLLFFSFFFFDYCSNIIQKLQIIIDSPFYMCNSVFSLKRWEYKLTCFFFRQKGNIFWVFVKILFIFESLFE